MILEYKGCTKLEVVIENWEGIEELLYKLLLLVYFMKDVDICREKNKNHSTDLK